MFCIAKGDEDVQRLVLTGTQSEPIRVALNLFFMSRCCSFFLSWVTVSVAAREEPQARPFGRVVAEVVDLEGGVLDAVLAGKDLFEVSSSGVAILVATDEHVGRERRKAGGDGPDMQVVNLRYARNADHAPADLVGVDSGRRAFEQNVDRVAHEPPGASQDQ